jgi:hypothetical protein
MKKLKFVKLIHLLSISLVLSAVLWISCAHKGNPVDSGSGNTYSGQPTLLANSPYPLSQKPDTLFVVNESNFSDTEILTIKSLQGILAQSKPRIYCIGNSGDSYSVWLSDLKNKYGVTVDYTYQSDLKGLINHFKGYLSGYILANMTKPSIHVAFSLAGIKDALVVIGSDESTIKGLGLSLVEDATNETYQQFFNNHKNEMCKTMLCYQAPEKANFLSDYAVYGKSYFFYEELSSALSQQIFATMNANSALLGWGDSENGLVESVSQKSIIVHAADYANNLSALSNFGVETKQGGYNNNPDVQQDVHTVCFLMTDGDNIQWLLGPFGTSTTWFASTSRKKTNIGWTMSPAFSELAPTVLKRFYDAAGTSKGGRDYFVAGPSGMGYVFPDTYGSLDSYASLTNLYMKKADLRILNIIGNSMNSNYLTPFLQQDQIDAIFYYYYSNYAQGNGQIYFINNKPVITAKYNLWSNTFESPTTLAEKLNASSTDITSKQAYSLIAVHVWTNSVDDVVSCVSMLNKNVRVVTPDEFVALINKNISH